MRQNQPQPSPKKPESDRDAAVGYFFLLVGVLAMMLWALTRESQREREHRELGVHIQNIQRAWEGN